jgi:Co/Zn/Cd efflux system component
MIFVRRKEIFHQNSHVFLEVHHDNVELEVRNAHVKDDVEKGQEKVANVNMISACTHIGGDSMRTAAVFIAASVTSTTRVSSTDCDAWASIVILLTITIMVLPLVREIYMACRRI